MLRKYRNKPTEVDGIRFDSRKEAKRYGDLKLAVLAGVITDLRLQVPYRLTVNGYLICTYRADFVYEEKSKRGHWIKIVEDVKGIRTRDYMIKNKLMKALHGIEIRET